MSDSGSTSKDLDLKFEATTALLSSLSALNEMLNEMLRAQRDERRRKERGWSTWLSNGLMLLTLLLTGFLGYKGISVAHQIADAQDDVARPTARVEPSVYLDDLQIKVGKDTEHNICAEIIVLSNSGRSDTSALGFQDKAHQSAWLPVAFEDPATGVIRKGGPFPLLAGQYALAIVEPHLNDGADPCPHAADATLTLKLLDGQSVRIPTKTDGPDSASAAAERQVLSLLLACGTSGIDNCKTTAGN